MDLVNLKINNQNLYKSYGAKNPTKAVSYPISQAEKDMLVKKEEQAKHQKKYGLAVAGTTIGVGLTALAIGTGFSKKGRANINKFYNYLSKKSEELSKKPIVTKSEQMTQKAVDTTKGVLESTRAVMNTISLKDILFKKITDPIPVIGKACQGITNFFEEVAEQTTLASYKNTAKNFRNMFAEFDKIQNKGSNNLKQISEQVLKNVKDVYSSTFSVGETTRRIEKNKDVFKTLDEDFWNRSFKNFKKLAKDKDTYSSFIAEQMLAGEKSKLLSEINSKKSIIKFTHKDDYNNLKNIADDIRGMVDPFQQETTKLLDNIKGGLDKFNKKESSKIRTEVIENMKKLTEYVDDKSVAEQFRKSIEELPQNNGIKLQDLLMMYKKDLSAKEYKKLEKSVNKAIKSLEKSTVLETDNLFDKRRDLKIGSAPTDMLTLLATFLTVGIGLGQAKNKDERESAALKYGIPAIGTVITSMYGNIKMYTAAKSLLFGAVTGLLINKLGEGADQIRISLNSENNQ